MGAMKRRKRTPAMAATIKTLDAEMSAIARKFPAKPAALWTDAENALFKRWKALQAKMRAAVRAARAYENNQ